MNLEELVEKTPYWMNGNGNLPELVISSRARIARNLADFPFEAKLAPQERIEIFERVKDAVMKLDSLKDSMLLKVDELDELDKAFLIERHHATLELLKDGKGRGVIITEDEMVSIMVNEEDHLRIQVFTPGLSIEDAFSRILEIEEEIGKKLNYAYDESLGFLTSCPTNTGTGLRLSVLVHLPGIVFSRRIEEFLKKVKKNKVSVRGLYGEGSDIQGNIFQISSQVTLGVSEEETLSSFKEVVSQIIEFEKKSREFLMENMRDIVEDKVFRSKALLENARILSFRETAEYVSALRLGLGIGLLFETKIRTLNELLLFSQPSHLQKIFGKKMDSKERDIKRASYVRTKLKAG